MASLNLLSSLQKRGLISQITSKAVINGKIGVYLGVDPTASSLHLGNLMPFMVLMHFYLNGHRVYPLVGGATGAVGDPSGRSSERTQLETNKRLNNVNSITTQMKNLLTNSAKSASKYLNQLQYSGAAQDSEVSVCNNLDWWKDMTMLSFLGNYGRYIRVGTMLAKDSVSQRMRSESGLGYNEFSYQVMQAYDFYHLYRNFDCSVQIGGHDQWGNIVSGVDLINRLKSKPDTSSKSISNSNSNLNNSVEPVEPVEPIGITVPLLLAKNGEKFGKSAGNAVFLDAKLTTAFDMYQHLLKSPDDMVETYLKSLTFIPIPIIEEILETHRTDPELRLAQRRLAREVTELVHGVSAMESAESISALVFSSDPSITFDADNILNSFENQGMITTLPAEKVLNQKWKQILPTIVNKSKSEVQRLVQSRSIYVGLQKKVVTSNTIENSDIESNGLLLIRIGKTEYHVVKVV